LKFTVNRGGKVGFDLNKLTKNRALLLNLILGIIVVLILRSFYFSYKDKMAQMKQETQICKQKVSLLNEIKPLAAEVDGYFEKFSGKEKDTLVSMVTNFAREAGVKINSFTPRESREEEFSVIYPLVLNMEGSYHNLGKFISLLESAPEVIRIEQITVKKILSVPEGSERADATIEASCDIIVSLVSLVRQGG
jgi:Tfp pilus assembly protein PilO